jgi:hypothetical protein
MYNVEFRLASDNSEVTRSRSKLQKSREGAVPVSSTEDGRRIWVEAYSCSLNLNALHNAMSQGMHFSKKWRTVYKKPMLQRFELKTASSWTIKICRPTYSELP